MPAQSLPDIAGHPEVLGICAVLAILMILVPPLLELRSWRRGLSRFEVWLRNGGRNHSEAKQAITCSLCGSGRLKTSTVASFASTMRFRPIQCATQGTIRFVETRCGVCGTTISRLKEVT